LISSFGVGLSGAVREGDGPANYVQEIPETKVSFAMVYIPGGSARHGSPEDEAGRDADEGPARVAEVAPFFLGRTEVTWDEFEAFYLGRKTPDGVDAISRPSPSYHPHDRGWGRGKRPAVGMSWHAAKTYCEWLSGKTGLAYRLPTEAEWEFAARAGSLAASPESLPDVAWFAETSGGKTQEVGTKKPNAFGLCDMLGNAWEYCLDPYEPNGKKPVLRGGSWKEPGNSLRFANRQVLLDQWNERDPQRPRSQWWIVDGPFVGFRVARSAAPPPPAK
jgi:formylglycine-generating enzyme required for sulfatase activity